MKASEALKMANDYHTNQKEGYERYLELVYEKVELNAKNGRYEFNLPAAWRNFTSKPNQDQLNAIINRLRSEGYYVYENDKYVEPLMVNWNGGD